MEDKTKRRPSKLRPCGEPSEPRTTTMKDEYDFSKGERGKFYRPGAVFRIRSNAKAGGSE
jgi:hypothetical protein